MAYSKFVIWDNPANAGTLALGTFGLKYTRVIVDLPYYQGSRNYWKTHDVFTNSDNQQQVTLQTSIPYDPTSIKLYADGVSVAITKVVGASQREVAVQGSLIDGKMLYFSYIPKAVELYMGDKKDDNERVYGILCDVESSLKLRDAVQTIRKHIITFCDILNIQKPLWYGGFANKDVGAYNNLIAGVTETSIDLHLGEIQAIFENVIIAVNNLTGKTIAYTKTPAFTISYLEFLQEGLTLADAAMKERG
jgi:hypothetical protein